MVPLDYSAIRLVLVGSAAKKIKNGSFQEFNYCYQIHARSGPGFVSAPPISSVLKRLRSLKRWKDKKLQCLLLLKLKKTTKRKLVTSSLILLNSSKNVAESRELREALKKPKKLSIKKNSASCKVGGRNGNKKRLRVIQYEQK